MAVIVLGSFTLWSTDPVQEDQTLQNVQRQLKLSF